MSDRVAPGGKSTLILGCDDSTLLQEVVSQISVATPTPAPRFSQAVGGNSTICLGGKEAVPTVIASDRVPAGGTSTIVLGGDAPAEALTTVTSQRVPAGGVASVVLGTDLSAEAFARPAVAEFEAPTAVPRFPQEPGGTASIILGGGTFPSVQEDKIRGPPGGTSTVLLGTDDTGAILCQRKDERTAYVETPDPATRFLQAPGGSSSINLGGDGEIGQVVNPNRGPVGGAATIILGIDNTKEIFEGLQQERSAQVCTSEAAPRFQQEPGGKTSICLGTYGLPGDGSVVEDATRGPVGGPGHIVLGSDDNKAMFKQLEELREAPVNTPSAAPRFSQAPGGNAAIKLGPSDTQADDVPAVRGPVGGETTLSLGGSYPDDMLQKATNVLKDGASSNRFANGANQNSGNVITDRPTTRLHFAPGGASTICLGSDDGDKATNVLKERASANRFANGANQNCGNVITDRPTTRLHFAPGGASTICLGNDDPDIPAKATLSVAASKLSAVVTDENTSTENVAQNQDAKDAVKRGALIHGKQAPGGVATVVLG